LAPSHLGLSLRVLRAQRGFLGLDVNADQSRFELWLMAT